MFIRRLKPIVTLALLTLLTFYLFQTLNVALLRTALTSIPLATVSTLLLLQLLTLILLTLQYGFLFHDFKLALPFKILLSMHFIGVFYESITPMFKVGGEVFKVRFLNQKGYSKLHTSSVIVSQKIISFTAFFTLLFTTIIIAFFRQSLITISFPVWLYFLLSLGFISWITMSALFVFKKRFPANYNIFKHHLLNIKKHLPVHLILALLIWLLFSVKSYLLFQHFNLSISFMDAQLITLLTYTVSLIPLTPGALGTNEATMVALLSLFLVPFYQALAATLILRFTTFWFVFFLSLFAQFITVVQPLRRRTHAAS